MLKLQLRGEISDSIAGTIRPLPVNPDIDVVALVEERKGYGQFRIVLPGTVLWSEKVALVHGMPGTTSVPLEAAIRLYLPEDRKLVVETLAQALGNRSGFSYVARLEIPTGRIKTVECLGDVTVVDDRVTGAFGVMRDISRGVEREAVAIGRARLIRHMVEDLPVPVVVLDRALRVVGCSAEWAKAYGLGGRSAALGQSLEHLTTVGREITAAIIEALHGETAQLGLWFYSGETGQQVRRTCVVIPWQCGADAPGGVIMVVGGGEASYASLEVADKALGRTTKTLLQLLESL
jgi:PAS domain-containing protein